MKKVIFSLTLLIIVIFVAVKIAKAQNNKDIKKQTTEMTLKCPGMTCCLQTKVAEKTDVKACDPKCKEIACDPSKCSETNCDSAKCKARASCKKGTTESNTAEVASKTCNPAMCGNMK